MVRIIVFYRFTTRGNGEVVPYLKLKNPEGRNVVWRRINEVAAGLGYLHAQGIVHGNLKGNNIMVDHHGIPMLIGFGLSFQESGSCSLTKMKDTLGPMTWQAPEFAHMTDMPPTHKSDVCYVYR
ncbi:Serine/threonine protein kinase [Phytophthora megakarya]|uniref:Serine/threonine protein kinase n=1 Tax=Phytophthora megakarya TaxID=4795 RepID=A0A225X459_9STRA|nr:Serine/threonine protein kinase [Phytophthora megakarya]